jgi:hypothetical protein
MSVYGTVIVSGVEAAWISVPIMQMKLPQPRRRPPRARRTRRTRRRSGPAYVYRFVDRHGRRGYIGKTNNLRRRLREHGFNPDHVEVLRLPNEDAALAAEQRAIQADSRAGQPLVNVIHNRPR